MAESNERVRREILDEHTELRAIIAKIRGAGDPGCLALATAELLDRLAAHLEHEDAVLAPVLRTIDAWGPERARRLRDDHVAQRAQLAQLRRELATTPEAALASTVRAFVDALVADMESEERDVLDAALLRDDCVTVEFGG